MNDGRVIISGYYVSGFDLDFSENSNVLESGENTTDFFVATYSNEGEFMHVLYGENIGDSEYVDQVKLDQNCNI